MQDLSSLTKDWTLAPAVEAQSLNHWTASWVDFCIWYKVRVPLYSLHMDVQFS